MFSEILNLFYPRLCAGCEDVLLSAERVLCVSCLHHIATINSMAYAEDLIKRQFYGRVPVSHAASLLFFHKEGIVQRMIHQLKYRKNEEISWYLGNWFVETMRQTDWVHTVDVVIPVPLHASRKRKRGYNQVSGFGLRIAENFQCVYREDILIKEHDSRTQVFKSRIARTEIQNTYFTMINKDFLNGKHILLVDDIITTGATLETCMKNLLKGAPKKISLATMAITV